MEQKYKALHTLIESADKTVPLNSKTACVISGGGALGAYTIGRMSKLDRDYDYVVGCSTGSLIAPLAALKKWDVLREAYTNIEQKDIFDVNPFNENGKLKIFHSIFRIITGKKTIGENKNLKKLIVKYFTKEDYEELRRLGKDVIITVANITKKEQIVEYKSIMDHDYEKFVEFMWASASVPVVCSYIEIDNKVYVDGGLCETTPLTKGIEAGAGKIDCYIHSLENEHGEREKPSNIFKMLVHIWGALRKEITSNDLLNGLLEAKQRGIVINLKFLPERLSNNMMIFDKEKMRKWYELGYNSEN